MWTFKGFVKVIDSLYEHSTGCCALSDVYLIHDVLDKADGFGNKAIASYSGGDRFESRPEHRLS
jgi:hypothetical protein